MKNKTAVWYQDKVIHGGGGGKIIGYPTINLSPRPLLSKIKMGVYAALVRYQNKIYRGALYLGPRLIKKGKKIILEIHILDFNQPIYGQTIEFQIVRFIRPPIAVKNIDQLKKQIKNDVEKILAVD